jgi:hypothetical protein
MSYFPLGAHSPYDLTACAQVDFAGGECSFLEWISL